MDEPGKKDPGGGCEDDPNKDERSYYYDDAHGYEQYDPREDADVDEDEEEAND